MSMFASEFAGDMNQKVVDAIKAFSEGISTVAKQTENHINKFTARFQRSTKKFRSLSKAQARSKRNQLYVKKCKHGRTIKTRIRKK